MEHFAGLDVGTHLTSVCVIDAKGEIQFEAELATDPDLLAKALKKWRASLRQIGHEADSMAPWLHTEMAARGFKMVCLEAFHARQPRPPGDEGAAQQDRQARRPRHRCSRRPPRRASEAACRTS